MFLRRVFVSHYCNVPYHMLLDRTLYPQTLVEELYAASFHLIRNFELAPFANDTSLEDMIAERVNEGKI
nr:MAG TPA: hypothetical protein [Caudoviricetes sp.]